MTEEEYEVKKEMMALDIASHTLIEEASNIKYLSTEEEQKKALHMLGNIRKTRKSIDGKRKAITESARKFTSETNEKAKEMMEPLQKIESQLEQMIFAYTTKQLEIKEDKCSLEDPVVRSNGTSMFLKWKSIWNVEDFDKIPREYLTVDEKKIEKAIDFGIDDIEGIEIKKKLTSQVRVV